MKIVPLSRKTLENAKVLANKCFPVQMENESSDGLLEASLGMRDVKSVDPKGVFIKYWVVATGKKVVGLVGLYGEKKKIKNEYWLAHFCVHPKFRLRGIGTALIDFATKKARADGKKRLVLYTTNSRLERAAQFLYDKKGFRITTKKKVKKFPYTLIYRRLVL